MKLRYLLLLLLIIAGCSDDKLPEGPDDYSLNYDGPNVTSPNLPGGQYQLAVKFPAAVTSPETGKKLTSVAFFIYELPKICEIKIYGPGTPGQPGAPLYSKSIGSELKKNRWNFHFLSTPVELDGNDLWVSVKFSHNNDQQTLGCDDGPRNINGDWSFFSIDNTWQTFRARTNADINWNIRCKVE